MKTYRAQEIANYIVNRSIERGHPVNNLTLMNLLYYLQRKSLRQKSQCLFWDEFEAWQIGPVVPNVYYTFCTYGATPIFLKQKELPDLDWAAKMMIDGTLVLCGLMPWDWAREIKYVGGAWDIVYCSGNIGDPIPIDLIIEKG